MSKGKKIIVKVGTSTLTKGSNTLSRRIMLELVRQVAELNDLGHQMILVSSGAGAAGREVLKQPAHIKSMPFKQMLAAVGQPFLMQAWADLFAIFNISVGQVLLTLSDFSNRQRYLNARDTLHALLHHHVIPIINENDTVATEEIKVGDNDNLSAMVSNLIGADLLILLTDIEGLYTADPRLNPQAKLIPSVDKIDESIWALAGKSITGLGTGGMVTKLEAAQTAMQSGTSVVIASSSIPAVLPKIVSGEAIGTLFRASTSTKESRKRWLLSEKPVGSLTLDHGAAEGLQSKGGSLLPVGVRKILNKFERGAMIELLNPEGKPIARGISNYSSEEIEKIQGVKTDQIEVKLGFTCGDEIVHRDQMILISTRKLSL
jgi:glutamate 5-kinase